MQIRFAEVTNCLEESQRDEVTHGKFLDQLHSISFFGTACTFCRILTFTTIKANAADYKFSYFPQNTGFDMPCKLSRSLRTICMKCQNIFSERI